MPPGRCDALVGEKGLLLLFCIAHPTSQHVKSQSEVSWTDCAW